MENEYEDDNETDITFHMPKNTEKVRFYFRGEKIAKCIGTLAHNIPKQDQEKGAGFIVWYKVMPCQLKLCVNGVIMKFVNFLDYVALNILLEGTCINYH